MIVQVSLAGNLKIDLPNNLDPEQVKILIEQTIKQNLNIVGARLYVNVRNGHWASDQTIEIGNKEEVFKTKDIFHIKQTDKLHERW